MCVVQRFRPSFVKVENLDPDFAPRFDEALASNGQSLALNRHIGGKRASMHIMASVHCSNVCMHVSLRIGRQQRQCTKCVIFVSVQPRMRDVGSRSGSLL